MSELKLRPPKLRPPKDSSKQADTVTRGTRRSAPAWRGERNARRPLGMTNLASVVFGGVAAGNALL